MNRSPEAIETYLPIINANRSVAGRASQFVRVRLTVHGLDVILPTRKNQSLSFSGGANEAAQIQPYIQMHCTRPLI
jgi:hypothetical protein